jgi:G3E family GTPase
MFGRRQRSVRGHRIAVVVARPGESSADRDTAVVIDDFGADEVSLGTGCRCCTVRGELQEALRRMAVERNQRQHFNRIIIETRNDTGPILRTFASERGLAADYHVETHPPVCGNAFTLTDDAPLDWNAFSRFVATLVALRGADLLHVKGTLNVKGCQGPVVVQYLQHLAHRPVEFQAWPDEDRASRLTFVTRNMDERVVRSLFDAVCALSQPSP